MKIFLKFLLLATLMWQKSESASIPNRIVCRYDNPDTCIIENYSTHSKDQGAIVDLFTENTYELKIELVNSSVGTLDNFLCKSFKYINVIDFAASEVGITDIDGNALKYCRGVTKVDLSRNSIQDIERGTFKYTRNLRNLDLSYNNLDYLDSRVFAYTKRLEILDMGNNNLKYLQASIFKPVFNSLQLLNIQNNRLLGVENLDNLYQKVHDVAFDANYFLCADAMFQANLITNLKDMGCLDESSWLEMVSRVIEHDNADVPHELKQKFLKIKVEYTGKLYEKKIENTRAALLQEVSAKAEDMKMWFQQKLLQSLEEKSNELNGDINKKWEHLTIEFNNENQDIEKKMKEFSYEIATEDEKEAIEEDDDEEKPEKLTKSSFIEHFDEVAEQVADWSKGAWNSFLNLF